MAYTPELRQDYKRNTETDCMGAWLAHDNENRITQTIFLNQQIGLPGKYPRGAFFVQKGEQKNAGILEHDIEKTP